MQVNKNATRLARRRHNAGVKRLREIFEKASPALYAMSVRGWPQSVRQQPVRLRPNVPPVRDAEHQAKHRKRKAARASTRRNRA